MIDLLEVPQLQVDFSLSRNQGQLNLSKYPYKISIANNNMI
jgi:hypothetical protein